MSTRPLTICLALALVVSLATSAFASCMADPSMSAGAQMACCKAGHDQCPMHGTAADCCKVEGQKQQHVVANSEPVRLTLQAPALVATVIVGSIASIAPLRAIRVRQQDRPRIPATPDRFLASSLLI